MFQTRKKTSIPKFTILIWLTTLVALLLMMFSSLDLTALFAIIPTEIVAQTQQVWWHFLKIFSALFLHGSWQHWLGNMLLFLIIALPLEKIVGGFWFLLIYFVAGFAANVTSIILLNESSHYLLGASGAVSGLLGAWIMLFPTQSVSIIIPVGFYIQKAKIPIILLAIIWLSFQILLQLINQDNYTIVWSSHIIGFISGFFMAWLYTQISVPQSRYRNAK